MSLGVLTSMGVENGYLSGDIPFAVSCLSVKHDDVNFEFDISRKDELNYVLAYTNKVGNLVFLENGAFLAHKLLLKAWENTAHEPDIIIRFGILSQLLNTLRIFQDFTSVDVSVITNVFNELIGLIYPGSTLESFDFNKPISLEKGNIPLLRMFIGPGIMHYLDYLTARGEYDELDRLVPWAIKIAQDLYWLTGIQSATSTQLLAFLQRNSSDFQDSQRGPGLQKEAERLYDVFSSNINEVMGENNRVQNNKEVCKQLKWSENVLGPTNQALLVRRDIYYLVYRFRCGLKPADIVEKRQIDDIFRAWMSIRLNFQTALSVNGIIGPDDKALESWLELKMAELIQSCQLPHLLRKVLNNHHIGDFNSVYLAEFKRLDTLELHIRRFGTYDMNAYPHIVQDLLSPCAPMGMRPHISGLVELFSILSKEGLDIESKKTVTKIMLRIYEIVRGVENQDENIAAFVKTEDGKRYIQLVQKFKKAEIGCGLNSANQSTPTTQSTLEYLQKLLEADYEENKTNYTNMRGQIINEFNNQGYNLREIFISDSGGNTFQLTKTEIVPLKPGRLESLKNSGKVGFEKIETNGFTFHIQFSPIDLSVPQKSWKMPDGFKENVSKLLPFFDIFYRGHVISNRVQQDTDEFTKAQNNVGVGFDQILRLIRSIREAVKGNLPKEKILAELDDVENKVLKIQKLVHGTLNAAISSFKAGLTLGKRILNTTIAPKIHWDQVDMSSKYAGPVKLGPSVTDMLFYPKFLIRVNRELARLSQYFPPSEYAFLIMVSGRSSETLNALDILIIKKGASSVLLWDEKYRQYSQGPDGSYASEIVVKGKPEEPSKLGFIIADI